MEKEITMTQEEKRLLFIDLCARLPYGVICKLSVKGVDVSITVKLELGGLEHFIAGTMCVKPFLRSLSSMTEEEEKKYNSLNAYEGGIFPHTEEAFDWLNTNHFDYRDLIGKGLALEASKDMYKTE